MGVDGVIADGKQEGGGQASEGGMMELVGVEAAGVDEGCGLGDGRLVVRGRRGQGFVVWWRNLALPLERDWGGDSARHWGW